MPLFRLPFFSTKRTQNHSPDTKQIVPLKSQEALFQNGDIVKIIADFTSYPHLHRNFFCTLSRSINKEISSLFPKYRINPLLQYQHVYSSDRMIAGCSKDGRKLFFGTFECLRFIDFSDDSDEFTKTHILNCFIDKDAMIDVSPCGSLVTIKEGNKIFGLEMKENRNLSPSCEAAASTAVVTTNGVFFLSDRLSYWDRKTGETTHFQMPMKKLSFPTSAILSFDHRYLITIGSSSSPVTEVLVWEIDKNKLKSPFSLRGHTNGITCLYATEKYILTGSHDRCVRLWSLETKKSVMEVRCSSAVLSIAATSDSRFIAVLSITHILLFDIISKVIIKREENLYRYRFVHIGDNGNFLLVGENHCEVFSLFQKDGADERT